MDIGRQDTSELADILSQIDRSKPDGEHEGRPFWRVRCRIWASGLTAPIGIFGRVVDQAVQDAANAVPEEGDEAQRDLGVPPGVRAKEANLPSMVEGIASSTSRDYYGTEFSIRGLESMQRQFARGVPLVPAHRKGGMFGDAMDWDDTIGTTKDAKITQAQVANPAVVGEVGYTLSVTSELDLEEARATSLARRLNRGQAIGQSIGGWFVEVRVITNDEDEVERIIIDDVELDHLAITRMPANPDAKGLVGLRTKMTELFSTPKTEVVDALRAAGATVTESPATEPAADDRGKTTTTVYDPGTGPQVHPSGCSLSVTEEANRVRIEFPVDASDEDVRGGAAAILRGEHGEPAKRAIEIVRRRDSGSDTAELDTAGGAREDGIDPVDASDSATPAEPDEPKTSEPEVSLASTEERTMPTDPTNPTLADLLAELRSVGTRLTNLEARGTGTPAQTEEEKLQAQVADLQARVKAYEDEPVRRGVSGRRIVPSIDGVEGEDILRSLVTRAQDPQFGRPAKSLARVVEKGIVVLSTQKVGEVSRHVLEDLLRSVCVAGERDGLIVDRSATQGSWN